MLIFEHIFLAFYIFICNPIGGIFIGLMIGLLNSNNNKKEGVRWKIYYKKLIFLGIPSLLIYCYFFIIFLTHQVEVPLMLIPGICVGYTIATSFYKSELTINDKQQDHTL